MAEGITVESVLVKEATWYCDALGIGEQDIIKKTRVSQSGLTLPVAEVRTNNIWFYFSVDTIDRIYLSMREPVGLNITKSPSGWKDNFTNGIEKAKKSIKNRERGQRQYANIQDTINNFPVRGTIAEPSFMDDGKAAVRVSGVVSLPTYIKLARCLTRES